MYICTTNLINQMKTVVLIKKKVGRFELTMRTDGMYSATDLEKLYNSTRGFEQPERRLDKYLANDSAKEYIEFLQKTMENDPKNKLNLNTPNSGELKIVDRKLINKSIIDTKRGRHNSGTFLCEDLFIDFAMWISVEFKHWAVQIVKERLAELRNEAGDNATLLKSAIAKCYEANPNMLNYKREFDMLNKLTFGSTTSNQRETATKKQLSILNKLQLKDIKLLEQGESQKSFSQREKELTYLAKFMNDTFDDNGN